MKHSLKITLLLVLFFLLAQFVGLLITNSYIDHKVSVESGKTVFKSLPGGLERPQVDEGTSFIPIFIAILVGTVLALVIIRFKRVGLWKLWFFLSVLLCLTVAFGAFSPPIYAFVLAFVLSAWKILRPNIYVHNLTEIFVYGGLAAIFVPIINLLSVIILLALISGYDMFAVWQSKHMVKLANFQTESKLFAGLFIPYALPKAGKKLKGKLEMVKVKVKSAILGGGDIGFPLIFAGVIMKGLMLNEPVFSAFAKTLIIPLFAGLALLYLLVKAEKDKFYPAMPFLSIGCLAGYGVLWIIGLF